jgi:hypothetical protein
METERENMVEKKPENIHLMIDDLYNNVNIQTDEKLEQGSIETNKDLDMSWINEYERLSSMNENYIREPMDSINMYFIYINRNLYIEKIVHDKQPLTLSEDKKYSYLPKEVLLQIIQSRKIKTPFSKYRLTDVLSYLVDLEPEHIQSYSKNENVDQSTSPSPFLKVLPIMNDVQMNSSIFIFHDVNTVYFLFQEVELLNHRHTYKSILKSPGSEISDKSNTKKVRMQLTSVENSIKKRVNKGTRKKMT